MPSRVPTIPTIPTTPDLPIVIPVNARGLKKRFSKCTNDFIKAVKTLDKILSDLRASTAPDTASNYKQQAFANKIAKIIRDSYVDILTQALNIANSDYIFEESTEAIEKAISAISTVLDKINIPPIAQIPSTKISPSQSVLRKIARLCTCTKALKEVLRDIGTAISLFKLINPSVAKAFANFVRRNIIIILNLATVNVTLSNTSIRHNSKIHRLLETLLSLKNCTFIFKNSRTAIEAAIKAISNCNSTKIRTKPRLPQVF